MTEQLNKNMAVELAGATSIYITGRQPGSRRSQSMGGDTA